MVLKSLNWLFREKKKNTHGTYNSNKFHKRVTGVKVKPKIYSLKCCLSTEIIYTLLHPPPPTVSMYLLQKEIHLLFPSFPNPIKSTIFKIKQEEKCRHRKIHYA